jgi:hypothetical protein
MNFSWREMPKRHPMSDNPHIDSLKPERPDAPPPVPVSPHLLTWWFGLIAAGGLGFGAYADQQPFGNGMLAHPLVVFFAFVAAGLLTLRFVQPKPLLQVIPVHFLAAGAVIGTACFFIGKWFGVSLIHMP